MDIDDIFYGYHTFYTTSMVITSIQHYMGKIFNPNWLYFCIGSKSTVRGVVWVHDIFLPSCSVVSWRVTPFEPVGEDSSTTRHGEHRLCLAKKSWQPTILNETTYLWIHSQHIKKTRVVKHQRQGWLKLHTSSCMFIYYAKILLYIY
jgi:hypothetical protein